MTTGVRSATLPRPLAWLLAPLRWLERARGRWRLALATLYLLIIAAAMVLVWRATSLNRLPDIGDPFDVRALTMVEVPDAENAFVLYRQASARYKPVMDRLTGAQLRAYVLDDWSKAKPEVRRWLEVNREALEIWRQGTERPKALYIRPAELTFETPMPVVQHLRDIARLAILEASRREQSGDVAGAWAMYRGVLRSSRHIGQYGCGIQRLVGTAGLRFASLQIIAWAADPKVDAPLLRRALADVRAVVPMTPPNSQMFQLECLSGMKSLEKPLPPWITNSEREGDFTWYHFLPGYWPARDWLFREPERSQRAWRLVFANWLAACDLPRGARPPLIRGPIELYRIGPPTAGAGPRPVGSIPPEELESWVESTAIARIILTSAESMLRATDADRPILDGLTLSLAEQLYTREHGGTPPKSVDDLVGRYLDHLPDAYVPPTPTTPGPTP